MAPLRVRTHTYVYTQTYMHAYIRAHPHPHVSIHTHPHTHAHTQGLGKTVQAMSLVHHLHTKVGYRGPFLVVAPLSTIPHWQREFTGWTDMNTIVYHGCVRVCVPLFRCLSRACSPLSGLNAHLCCILPTGEWRFL